MWNDISKLKSLSALFQWSSIGLAFISVFLQIGKYRIDTRKDYLAAIEQAKLSNPANQQIHIGTALIEIYEESADPLTTHYADSGAYLAFGKGAQAILEMQSLDSFVKQNGNNTVAWRATVFLDASDPSTGKPASFLKDAEYIQAGFGQLKGNRKILRGKFVVTINSTLRLEIDVPPQEAIDGRILVRDLSALKVKLEN